VTAVVFHQKAHSRALGDELFDETPLSDLGIPLEELEGTTPDKSANRLHVNVVGLTARQLMSLGQVILMGELERVHWRRLGQGILDRIGSGSINERDLSETLRNDLQKKL